jgi:nicotinate-nucleotide adenylyltransferase
VTPAAAARADPGVVPQTGPIGLLGGTFDPVHAGHLQLAAGAQSALALVQLRLIPAGQPWQKSQITPAHHRLAMLEIALQERGGDEGWVADPREIERAGPTYTVDTLREIRGIVGPAVPLVWILGFDQLCSLPAWREWESLIGLAHIAYARRAGQPSVLPGPLAAYVAAREAAPGALAGRACGYFAAFPMQPVDCSATQIRRTVAAGDTGSLKSYLSPGVLGYIQSHQLYLAVNGQ